MADIKDTDLFLVNRSGKSANASFEMIQASVLAGNLYINSPSKPPTEVEKGMIWVKINDDNTISLELAYGTDAAYPDFRPLDTGAPVVFGDKNDPSSAAVNFREGDLFYDQSTGELFLNKGGVEWLLLNSIGSLSNVHEDADTPTEDGEFLEYKTTDGKYHASGRSVPDYIYDLKDVYTSGEFEPNDGDSLVFFDDVYEGRVPGEKYPGWKPKEVKGGSQLTPKLNLNLTELNPNIQKAASPRFTSQEFDVHFDPVDKVNYEYGNYQIQARVDGTFNRGEITEKSSERLYLVFDDQGSITGLQEGPTTYTPIEGTGDKHFKLTFPATFEDEIGNGKTPDETLNLGTGITVEGKYTVDDVLDGEKTSNTVTPLEGNDPDLDVPDMYGLRVDNNRKTDLHRTGTSPSNTFTVSLWVKRTGFGLKRVYKIQPEGGSSDVNTICLWSNNDSLRVNAHTSTMISDIPGALPLNEWVHIVVNRNETTVNAYVNGVKHSADFSQTFGFGDYGYDIPGKTGDDFSGYYSDVYFASNKLLLPTAFAYTDEVSQRWTPLSLEDVTSNLEAVGIKQPYDSRANTDQVWSSQVVPTNAETAKAFDGNTNTSGSTDTAFVWTTNITNVETLEIYTQANGLNAGTYSTLEVNGENKTADLVSGNGWNTISNPPSTLTSINTNFVSTAEKIDVYGVKVNGRLLVDQGLWNNSQTWSENLTADRDFLAGQERDKAFDGFTTTYAAIARGTLNWTGNVSFTDKVEIRVQNSAQGYSANNGATSGNVPANTWTEIAVSSPFTQLSITGENGSTNDPARLVGIRVDGKILVDEGAQWDTTQVWSDNGTVTGNSQNTSNRGYRFLFDGQLDTGFTVAGGTAEATFTGMPAGSYQVYVNAKSTSTVTINDTQIFSDIEGWVPITGTLSKITLNQPDSGVAQTNAIKIGSKILVDGHGAFGENGFYLPLDPVAGIGADASGNDNDFTAENLGIGDSSQFWSSNVTSSNGFLDNGGPLHAFNGALGNYCDTAGQGETLTFNFPGGYSYSSKVEVYIAGQKNVNAKINDGGIINVTSDPATDAYYTIATGSGVLNKLELIGTTNYIACAAIRVDDVLLIDPSAVDTVFDTPVKNYAVLDNIGASNGYLTLINQDQTRSTIRIEGKVYFESAVYYKGNGDFESLYVGTQVVQYNNKGVVTGSGSVTEFTDGDVIGVAVDQGTGDYEFFKNGVSVKTLTNTTDLDNLFAQVASLGDAVQTVNYGQQPFIYNPPAGYDGLFTEVSLPAGPLTREQFDAVQNAIQQFSVDVATRRTSLQEAKASARTKLLALGLTETEVTALSLDL